ncbi:tRNA lysidine(34) synthetase TilS [Segniliparus rugosus]|uniref:tRNA(Ile)-lysidine synthase n=1 Tax=Segniliparus rugosus (strain ATCC BAA-974 / DSM 45345 / CCUG 50838 / CIP 108380 / JCM 13579 / CDC 945) TaxID=679197 RepID=E5XVH8_SEGRC|nr:tRNA lysidine(34) synthetase TilS [Segniliparus rugosus]EFV11645.2 tRNA(Ile)-lysidine synthetase [Segniliparus rugosus ATCC BAA-974]
MRLQVSGPRLWEVRQSVRDWLASHAPEPEAIFVGLSGGADSLALTAALARERGSVGALVVDHGLQPDSARTAERAARLALALGCASAQVLPVVVDGPGGLEAAARTARRAALRQASGAAPVLLAHTMDDQAETVLLGLGRGSGPRSIQGMRAWDDPWGRPLLGVRRATTRAVCAELGIEPHEDPMNTDPRFARARLRAEVLPLLEDVLQGGVAEALARTAAAVREDNGYLDDQAAASYARVAGEELAVAAVADLPEPIRRRTLRLWLLDNGAQALNETQIRAVDELVSAWRGQGPVAVPGALKEGRRLMVRRAYGRLRLVVA